MTLLPDNSVHLAITSPPYWQLKDYGTDNQIGFHDSYENYINNLNLVWKECYRTLHNGCRLCVNIGDQFAVQRQGLSNTTYRSNNLGVLLSGKIFRFILFLVLQKRISTSIPNVYNV
jgi:DNA modification methylase